MVIEDRTPAVRGQPGQHLDRCRPLQGKEGAIGELADLEIGLKGRSHVSEVGFPAASIDDYEQMVAGLADDQVVEDAAGLRGESV